MYRRIPVSQARDQFRDVVSRAEYGKEATVLTWRGKDVAAILPISEVDIKTLGPEKKPSVPTDKKRTKSRSA